MMSNKLPELFEAIRSVNLPSWLRSEGGDLFGSMRLCLTFGNFYFVFSHPEYPPYHFFKRLQPTHIHTKSIYYCSQEWGWRPRQVISCSEKERDRNHSAMAYGRSASTRRNSSIHYSYWYRYGKLKNQKKGNALISEFINRKIIVWKFDKSVTSSQVYFSYAIVIRSNISICWCSHHRC